MEQLVSVHVNHGLLRKGEPEQVVRVFRDELDANLVYVDATDRFLNKLAGVSDPEQKRKIIGAEFIRVFEEEARKQEGISFLAQGTIYPDIVESGPVKSHHNVGGLPEDLNFELVEPIKLLFKDEVRVVGKELGLPDNMVFRQPFPGPGLGVRCTGAITRDRLEALRESDAILREEFAKTRAAIEEGVVAGGGVTYVRALDSLKALKGDNADEQTGINIVERAIEEPLRQIVINAGGEGAVVVQKVREGEGDFGYNARLDKYEDLREAGVIDPAKVARVALENAASIAGMFLTTECLIVDKPEEKPAMPMGGAPGMGGMM